METETIVVVEQGGEDILAHAEIAMPQLDPSLYPNLIFWLVVSLVTLYFILTRMALPRISGIFAARNDAISNDLEQAAIFRRRASEAEAAYNAALAKARDEANAIAQDAKAQINRELASLLAKADAEISTKTAESEARIQEIDATSASSIAEVARATTFAIVSALGPRAVDEATVSAAVGARLKG